MSAQRFFITISYPKGDDPGEVAEGWLIVKGGIAAILTDRGGLQLATTCARSTTTRSSPPSGPCAARWTRRSGSTSTAEIAYPKGGVA